MHDREHHDERRGRRQEKRLLASRGREQVAARHDQQRREEHGHGHVRGVAEWHELSPARRKAGHQAELTVEHERDGRHRRPACKSDRAKRSARQQVQHEQRSRTPEEAQLLIDEQRIEVADPRHERHEVMRPRKGIGVDDSGREVDVVEPRRGQRAQTPDDGDVHLVLEPLHRRSKPVEQGAEHDQHRRQDDFVDRNDDLLRTPNEDGREDDCASNPERHHDDCRRQMRSRSPGSSAAAPRQS